MTLGADVTIIHPADVRENYVARLVELRKSKGLTEEQARAQLEDTVVLGTMMLEAGEVDGLVSGAFTPRQIPFVHRCKSSKQHLVAQLSRLYSSCYYQIKY